MPTEKELKFVLKKDDKLEAVVGEIAQNRYLIQQGYLKTNSKVMVRVRKKQDLETDSVQFFFQSKFNTGSRVIEVSVEINERDFLDFWKNSKGKIKKCRYELYSDTSDAYKDESGNPWKEIWELDFFKMPGDINYFSMAECEIPEEADNPLFEIPELVRDNTVFRVSLGDSRFTNKKLGDVQYAAKLYKYCLLQKGT